MPIVMVALPNIGGALCSTPCLHGPSDKLSCVVYAQRYVTIFFISLAYDVFSIHIYAPQW